MYIFCKCKYSFKLIPMKKTRVLYWSQKQPPELLYGNRCPYKFRRIHRETLVPGSLF